MDLTETLKATRLFARVKPRHLKQLARSASMRSYEPGDVIIEDGREGAGLFILASGEAEVIRYVGTPKETVIATLHPGECFGEAALLLRRKRTATVRAVEKTECVSLWRKDFISVMKSTPDLAISLLAVLFQRLDTVRAKIDAEMENLDLGALAELAEVEEVDIESLADEVV